MGLPILIPVISILLPLIHASTTPQHIIGSYILSPFASSLTDTSHCFPNITFSRFSFQPSAAISRVTTPTQFNIRINHRAITLNSSSCTSSDTIQALQSDHPIFALDDQGILNAWTRAGGQGTRQSWAEQLIVEAVKLNWIVGYDFTQLVCIDNILEAGVGYLWYQPLWDHVIGNGFQVRGGTRYLFMTFVRGGQRGCVYQGENIRGSGGPLSDPTNPDSNTPVDIPQAPPPEQQEVPSMQPVAGTPTPTPSVTPSAGAGEGGGTGNVFGDAAAASGNGGGDDGGAACFPKGETVEVEGLGLVEMGELGVGVRVRDGRAGFSDVFFFSHREERGINEFVSLETDGGKVVVLSEGHYLYVDTGMKAAGRVQVGEWVKVRGGGWERVGKVATVWREGRYAPHTMSGDLVVGGVVVSSYTTAVHPMLAHYVLLAPVRGLYRLGLGGWAEGWLDSGKDRLRRWMPKGPDFNSVGDSVEG